MSATRLCKTLGYWLLSSRPSHEDVMDLYAEWNKSSIALEHLFLAYLRDLQAKEGIPKRLKELVWNYQGAPRTFDQVAQGAKNALKVLLVVEVEKIERYKSLQPGQIFEACLRASLQAEDSAEADVKAWNEFRKSATSQYPAYAQVLSEDTLRIMGPRSKSKMATGKADSPGRRRSFSVDTPVAPTVPFSLDDNLPPLQENGHSSVDKQPIQFGRFGNKSHSVCQVLTVLYNAVPTHANLRLYLVQPKQSRFLAGKSLSTQVSALLAFLRLSKTSLCDQTTLVDHLLLRASRSKANCGKLLHPREQLTHATKQQAICRNQRQLYLKVNQRRSKSSVQQPKA